MRSRLDLQTLLETILPNVYFQPPPNVQIVYPCIVYSRERIDTDFSGNKPYNRMKRYSVTVIDRDPDSVYPDLVGALPMCVHDRSYKSENLNHDAFKIFF